jgi:hypothetical protein
VTITGTLAEGLTVAPPGEVVAIALAGVTQQATIESGGRFAATFATAGLAASGSPYTISYRYAGDGTFASEYTISSLSVAKAVPTVSLYVPAGSATYGQSVTLVATVTGAGAPGGTVTFLDGATTLGTAPVDASGQAALTVASLAVGANSITAVYGGSANVASGTSGPASVTVAADGSQVVLKPQMVVRKKKAVMIRLEADIEGMYSGEVAAGGTVRFLIGSRSLGTAAVVDGKATLLVNAGGVRSRTITVVYTGDRNYTSSTTGPERKPHHGRHG